MIILGSMRDYVPQDYDEVWFIMRSVAWLKNREQVFATPNVFHVPDLSPSPGLFDMYRLMVRDQTWSQDAFDNLYVPRFIDEMVENPNVRLKLNLLWYRSTHGKRILVICSCSNEELCHRSIIGGILLGAGVTVTSTTKTTVESYRKYYNMYKELKKWTE